MVSFRRTPLSAYGLPSILMLVLLSSWSTLLEAQDTVRTETSQGAVIRLSVADFKPNSADSQTVPLKRLFDGTLNNDLKSAGIFDLVSKSMIPQAQPGAPSEINLQQWSVPPTNAAMVVFGSFAVVSGKAIVNGYLYDVKNMQYPQVLAKQYNEDASESSVRDVAHRFADEIIYRLGAVAGIAESKIYYVKAEGGNKEIWEMDYDGANQHAITHLGSISMSPRVSPDNSRLAFTSIGRLGDQIRVYSLILGRYVNFTSSEGENYTPAWAPDGNHLAFTSSRSGDPEIWVSDAAGNGVRRLTSFRGPDVSPVWNPRTGNQIAWVSGRSGLPQIYIMDADGSGVTRLTDSGYATSLSWSPDGKFLAFAWDRKYGPGAPGGQDIYIMEVANPKNVIQLTHDMGLCDFPSWSPDGRHIVFANGGKDRTKRIWTMLVDGTQKQALTGPGTDMPNWSWK
jgi:TolB protein